LGTAQPGTADGEGEHQGKEQPAADEINEIHEYTPCWYCDRLILGKRLSKFSRNIGAKYKKTVKTAFLWRRAESPWLEYAELPELI
jgi:hypothetical protein